MKYANFFEIQLLILFVCLIEAAIFFPKIETSPNTKYLCAELYGTGHEKDTRFKESKKHDIVIKMRMSIKKSFSVATFISVFFFTFRITWSTSSSALMVFLWLLCVSEWVLYVLQFGDRISLFGSFYTSLLITLLHSSKPKRLPISPWYCYIATILMIESCVHYYVYTIYMLYIHLEYNNKLFVFLVRNRTRITETTANIFSSTILWEVIII